MANSLKQWFARPESNVMLMVDSQRTWRVSLSDGETSSRNQTVNLAPNLISKHPSPDRTL